MAPPPSGMPMAGDTVVGPNGQGVNLPGMPSPPPPFSDLPTDPSQMIPQ
jgi:hypothetical protein